LAAGLTQYLDKLKFNLVGYGCTTCIGNSGPLPDPSVRQSRTIIFWQSQYKRQSQFRGPNPPLVRANYLASPPLVCAYALAGRMDLDLDHRTARLQTRAATRLSTRNLAYATGSRIHGSRRVSTEQYRKQKAKSSKRRPLKAHAVPEGDLYKWEETPPI